MKNHFKRGFFLSGNNDLIIFIDLEKNLWKGCVYYDENYGWVDVFEDDVKGIEDGPDGAVILLENGSLIEHFSLDYYDGYSGYGTFKDFRRVSRRQLSNIYGVDDFILDLLE